MNFIGRLTQDAKVKDLKDDRQVVEFSVAVNRYYRPKGSSEPVTQTTYYNCSYWRSIAIASRLKKGALVEMVGGLTVNAYTDLQGNPRASLNFHVDNVTVYNSSKSNATPVAAASQEEGDDLPF